MHVCLALFGRDLFSEQCISHNYKNWRSSHNPEGIGIPVVFPKMWVSVIWMFFMEGGVLEVHHATHRNKKCFVCANIWGKIRTPWSDANAFDPASSMFTFHMLVYWFMVDIAVPFSGNWQLDIFVASAEGRISNELRCLFLFSPSRSLCAVHPVWNKQQSL